MNQLEIESFRKYLQIKTAHPSPDYEGCVKFLIGIANELGMTHKIIEVSLKTGMLCLHMCLITA